MSTISTALWITALGMGIVFGAILLLWAMMTLLTRLTADKHPISGSAPPAGAELRVRAAEDKSRAAAIAVAVALAEQGRASAHLLKEPPTAIVSAWQLGMRTRQMVQKGFRGRR